MKQYNKINNLVGWLAFAIAAFTYCMTIEPTASFWDCPEFITTGYKLEVGHPPGAPFFMLTANLFSLFASDPSQVALMVNIMSALMSAACILFLFWSITHLTKKLVCPNIEDMTTGPRPERPEIAAQYQRELPEFSLRLQAKAGLTGYAQVYGKYNTAPHDKLKMDLMYIANPSLGEDLMIIFATIKILFQPESTEGVRDGQTTAAK